MDALLLRIAELIARVPAQIEDVADTVKDNPTLMWILVGVGAFSGLVFLLGIIKHAAKAAVVGAVLSVVAWFWYFRIR